jgi:hypothetical protein
MAELLLDPMAEEERREKVFAPRLDTLSGKTIGLLDIGKAKGSFFLDRVEEMLREQYGVTDVLRRVKPTPGRVVPAPIRRELVEKCDAVIEALSD